MRHPIRPLIAFLLAAAACVTPAFAQQQTLTILHTNDTHGHLLPFSYPDAATVAGGEAAGMTSTREIGGIARRAALVKQLREQLARDQTPVWFVDSGDYSDGTPFSMEYRGEADLAAMNAAGYDLGTIGNHEFNHPAAHTRKLIAATKYQLVVSNVIDRTTGKPPGPRYVIRSAGPVRVGVFGLVTRDAASYPAAREAFDVLNEVQAARAALAALKGRADVFVLLSHLGEEIDKKLAAAVPEIDVIVGGDSHTRLAEGEVVPRSENLRAPGVNGTVIVQAHQWGGELGRLDLLFTRGADGHWRVDRYRARLLPVTADIAEDPGVAAVVARFWRPIASNYGEVVGQAEGEFATRGGDFAEYNLMADALRESFGADVAIENKYGVRAPLLRGPVTKGDLVTMDPFGNTVVRFKANGREIRDLLARFEPHVSGIRYRLEGRRVVEVTIGGRPLEDDRLYSGVTNSYFAAFALKGLQAEDTKKPRLDTLIEYIRKQGTIRPAYDGRRAVTR